MIFLCWIGTNLFKAGTKNMRGIGDSAKLVRSLDSGSACSERYHTLAA